MNDKIRTYIGFAIKKGAAVYGCDGIKVSKRHMRAILYTPTLSDNSLSTLRGVSERLHCPLLLIEDYEILQKKNCKAVDICDKSLADAIMENLMYVPREDK